MLAGISLLILGALCGTILRVPAFLMLNALILAVCGWYLRHESVTQISLRLIIGLLAIQCGYASTILARLLLGRIRERVRKGAKGNRS